jgi:hypothetical protein
MIFQNVGGVMHIPGQCFKENVFDKVTDTGGINPWDAAKITKNVFCQEMISTELCPSDCKECYKELRTQLDFSKTKPRSVRSLYIYRLRDAVERKKDERQEERANAPRPEVSADDPLAQLFMNLALKLETPIDQR